MPDQIKPSSDETANEELTAVLAMFEGREATKNAINNYPLVAKSLDKFGIKDAKLRLVAFATIRAESRTFKPVSEGTSRFNTLRVPPEYRSWGDASQYNLYEYSESFNDLRKQLGMKKRGLGNDKFGDGERYMGRGFIQITGKSQYLHYGSLIGRPDLVATPDIANNPQVAADILAAFIKDHQNAIKHALDKNDLAAVRRSVNGGIHGLANFVKAYSSGVSKTRVRGGADTHPVNPLP